jgi:hypothetical protein
MPPELLERAFTNTVELLKAQVVFSDANVLAHPRGKKEPEKQTDSFPASDAAPC